MLDDHAKSKLKQTANERQYEQVPQQILEPPIMEKSFEFEVGGIASQEHVQDGASFGAGLQESVNREVSVSLESKVMRRNNVICSDGENVAMLQESIAEAKVGSTAGEEHRGMSNHVWTGATSRLLEMLFVFALCAKETWCVCAKCHLLECQGPVELGLWRSWFWPFGVPPPVRGRWSIVWPKSGCHGRCLHDFSGESQNGNPERWKNEYASWREELMRNEDGSKKKENKR